MSLLTQKQLDRNVDAHDKVFTTHTKPRQTSTLSVVWTFNGCNESSPLVTGRRDQVLLRLRVDKMVSSPKPSRGRGLEVLEGSYRLFFVAEKQTNGLRTRRWNPVAPLGTCRFSVLPPKRFPSCCAPTNLRFCPLGQLWNSKYFQQIQQFITTVFLIFPLPFLATQQNFFSFSSHSWGSSFSVAFKQQT